MNSELMWHLWCRDWRSKPLQEMDRAELELMSEFPFLRTGRPEQKPPMPGTNWRNWLFMGGRGAGKTRAGAEWIRFAVLSGRMKRIALVGPTLGDVREVMIEGPSGLRSIEQITEEQPTYSV
jgi:phage terminase large subunit-like protein